MLFCYLIFGLENEQHEFHWTGFRGACNFGLFQYVAVGTLELKLEVGKMNTNCPTYIG